MTKHDRLDQDPSDRDVPDTDLVNDDLHDDSSIDDQDGEDWEAVPTGSGSLAFRLLVLITGTIGFVASLALTIERIHLLQNPQAVLVCDISPFITCGPAMESWQGSLLGFPNPLLGIGGFAIVITTAMAMVAGARLARWYWVGLQAGVLLAAALITFLQGASFFSIHALCIWCMIVWAATIPLTVAVTIRNLAAGVFGAGSAQRIGRRLQHFQVAVTAVWYFALLTVIALVFWNKFMLWLA